MGFLISCERTARRPASVKTCVQILSDLMHNTLEVSAAADSRQFVQDLVRAFQSNPLDPREMIAANNDLLVLTQGMLRNMGIETEVIEASINRRGFDITYDRLDLILGNSLLGKVQEGFGVKRISFDLLENALDGISGYYRREDGIISLNLNEIWNEIDIDKVVGTIRHEFTHAQFQKARNRGLRSIYSNSYHAAGDAKVAGISSAYQNYMSAEELYNYIGDAYGSLHDLSWYDGRRKILDEHLWDTFWSINSIERHAGDIGDIAGKFSQEINKLKKASLEEVVSKMKIEGDYIAIYDAQSRALKSFVDSEKRGLVDRFQQLNDRYIALNNRSTASRALNFIKILNHKKKLQATSILLLDAVDSEQRKLIRVAQNIMPQRSKSKQLTMEAMSALKKDMEGPLDLDVFTTLKQELRILANMPREKYVGFVGGEEAVNEVTFSIKRVLDNAIVFFKTRFKKN